jgi:hypothetical protein
MLIASGVPPEELKCLAEAAKQCCRARAVAEPQIHGSSPRIYSGEERFSAPIKPRDNDALKRRALR